MVFKRRNKRGFGRTLLEAVWPRGGWNRAAIYMQHRLRRLPDAPHRIARGIFAGILVSFTPLFGLHFTAAALIAWIMRGNIIAALMATFVGNPITFPFIAAFGVELGNWLLGHPGVVSPLKIFSDFGYSSAEFWHNIQAVFTSEQAHWNRLHNFFRSVFLPYLVGGLVWGIIAALAGYYLSLPLIIAYQNRRKKKLAARLAKRIAAKQAAQAGKETGKPSGSASPAQ